MNSLQGVGTTRLKPGSQFVPKVEYFKFSPSTSRYHRVMALAAEKRCSWREIITKAIDFYLEFHEKKTTILTSF